MQSWLKQKPQTWVGVFIVLVITIIGVRYLLVSHAATPYIAGQAVNGQLSGGAIAGKDSTASGGSSVTFDTPDCTPNSLPTATVDTSLDNTIDNQPGPGWVGGDSSFSTELPNGQVAFVFSDTLIGTAQTSGAATFTGFVHSSELVGKLPNLTSVYGGTYSAPTTLLTDMNATPAGAQWQLQATYVENNQQLIFVNQFTPVTGSPFDSFTGVSGVAIMDLPANGLPTYASVTPIPTDAATQWGNAVMTDNSYHYIYGLTTGGMKLARVPLGETLTASDWQYWNGSGWVSSEAAATVIDTTNQINGVVPSNFEGGYMALSIPGSVYTDTTVDVSYACAPQGPWSTPVPIYTIPEISEYTAEIAYMPNFHPELNNSSGMVMSYDIDELDGLSPLATNIHEYQPRFLYIK